MLIDPSTVPARVRVAALVSVEAATDESLDEMMRFVDLPFVAMRRLPVERWNAPEGATIDVYLSWEGGTTCAVSEVLPGYFFVDGEVLWTDAVRDLTILAGLNPDDPENYADAKEKKLLRMCVRLPL